MYIRRVCPDDYKTLEGVAKNILEPLYGDQSKALREWFSGEGFKHAFVLVGGDEIEGFLSLKANQGKSYLKISTLVVLDRYKDAGRGKKLLEKAKEVAKQLGYHQIIVTVSDSKQESLNFFIRSGFVIIDRKPGKYKPNSTEIILEMGEQK